MPMPGPLELVVILVIALLILGPGRLPDVGAALGKGIREFRKASSDIQDSVAVDTTPLPADPNAQPAPAAPVQQVAAAPTSPVAQPVVEPAAVAAVAAPIAAAAPSAAPIAAAPAPAPAPESFALPPEPTAPLMAAAAPGPPPEVAPAPEVAPVPNPASAEQPGSDDAS